MISKISAELVRLRAVPAAAASEVCLYSSGHLDRSLPFASVPGTGEVCVQLVILLVVSTRIHGHRLVLPIALLGQCSWCRLLQRLCRRCLIFLFLLCLYSFSWWSFLSACATASETTCCFPTDLLQHLSGGLYQCHLFIEHALTKSCPLHEVATVSNNDACVCDTLSTRNVIWLFFSAHCYFFLLFGTSVC